MYYRLRRLPLVLSMLLLCCEGTFCIITQSGCRSITADVSASELRYKRKTADGASVDVRLRSPREVEIQGAMIDPVNGVMTLTNYSAVPNQGALRAAVDEAAQRRLSLRDGLEFGRDALAMGVMYGTGGAVRPPLGGSGGTGALGALGVGGAGALSGPLSPEALAQIVNALRTWSPPTNAAALTTNTPSLTPPTR